MIILVECEMTANKANGHQGAPLLDHTTDDVLESMRDDLQKRKAMVWYFPSTRRQDISQETQRMYGTMSLLLDEDCCRLIHTWETWKKSSIHSVCPWGQVRVKVLSPNPQLLRLGQLLAKPRGVVPNKYTKAFKLSTKIEI
jgi:hypothetical protein